MRTIIHNGNIYIGNGNFAQAVAIENGVFTAVGTNEEILATKTTTDNIIDANGNAVTPGFNDSHQHLYGVGVNLESVQLMGVTSIDEIVSRASAFIAQNNIPAGKFVSGRGWNQDYFTGSNALPTRHDMDRISTEHPIVFRRACGHMAVCNTKALEVAGVTRETPQVAGAEFYYDNEGNPNGIFTEHSMALIESHIPAPTIEEIANTIDTAMDYALSHGITTVQTNDVKNENYNDMLEAYRIVYNRNSARIRSYHQCCFTEIESLNSFIADGYKTNKGDDRFKIGPIKLFVDGSLGARTALMRNPYNDDNTTVGIECMTMDQLNEFVSTADRNNCQVAVHAIGDRAIEMVIDAVENVARTGEADPNPNRHGIVHCQITDRPLLDRIKALNVHVLAQPIFIHYDMHIVGDRVGEELASTSYAFGDLHRMGVNISFGTDSPVEDLNTVENLYCAVARKDLRGNPDGGYYPEQAVSLPTAIDLYSAASAYNSFDEGKKGSIAVGQLADLAIFDRDIFANDIEDIKNAKVNLTMVGGEVAFTRN